MSKAPGYSSETYVALLFDYLEQQGHDAVAVLGEERPQTSDDGLARYPVARHHALFEKAIAVTGDPSIALKVGMSIRPEHYGVVGFVVMACATLQEAMSRMQRFERLVNDANRVHMHVAHDDFVLEWGSEGFSPGPYVDELGISAIVTFTRQMTGLSWSPNEVFFRHPTPSYIDVYEGVFGCPVKFSHHRTGLSAPAQYLNLPLPSVNEGLLQVLDAQAEQILARSPDPADLWQRNIYKAIHNALGRGDARISVVAKQLNTSPRSLQRRLAERDLSFHNLLEDARRQLAEHYLQDKRLQLADIALLLGYSEQSAFNRAFKRWHGRSPRQWREMSKT